MDWDDLRFLLEILQCSSLSAAAQRLGVNQSTVGRRLDSLESTLQVRLVRRCREGVSPTAAGRAIRENLERIKDEVRAIERNVSGLDQRLEGTVQVAAPVVLARRLIAPGAVALHAHYPDIVVQLHSYSGTPDRVGFNPDVLLQWSRFVQPNLIARRITTVPFGLYAARTYLARHGTPDPADLCNGHAIVQLTGDEMSRALEQWLAECARSAQTVLKTDSLEAQLAATEQGAGLALLPRFMADECAGCVRLQTSKPLPSAEIWLGISPECRTIPRVRVVVNHIATWLACRVSSEARPRSK